MSYLLTGGSGRLGTALQEMIDCDAPSHDELDISWEPSVIKAVEKYMPTTIIHCAAFTSPPRCEADPLASLSTNIGGTLFLAKQCQIRGIRMVYISTEYVFDGTKGNYKETDPVLPTGKYAWSKLTGEGIVQQLSDWLIVRCAFTDRKFPHAAAPVDQFSSRLPVDLIVAQLLPLLPKAQGIFHLGGARQSVYHYAESLGASPVKCSYRDFSFTVPPDASLDVSKYTKYIGGLQ